MDDTSATTSVLPEQPKVSSPVKPGMEMLMSKEIILVMQSLHEEIMEKLEKHDEVLNQLLCQPAPTRKSVRGEELKRKSRRLDSPDSVFTTYTHDDQMTMELAEQVHATKSRAAFGWRARAAQRTRNLVEKIVEHAAFDIFFGVVVLLNSVFIGVEVELSLGNGYEKTDLAVEKAIGYVFTFLFTMELLFRTVHGGCRIFWGEDCAWALLDLLIVTTSLWEALVDILHAMGDTTLLAITGVSSLKAFRIIRITRILKSVQIVRIFRLVVALRTLISSIYQTLKSLAWAMVLLGLIIYVFAVLFAQAVDDETALTSMSSAERAAASQFYGSLSGTMMSLFLAITGGVNWTELTPPLLKTSWLWMLLMLFYIAFANFAVLNVVTGVFCQSAIESIQNDHTTMMHQVLANKEAHLSKAKDLFEKLGADPGGGITYLMLQEKLHSPLVRQYFESLGLDIWDAWSFFKTLDLDHSGEVDIEEFLLGCLRVRGSAKAIDVSKLIHDQAWLIRSQGKFQLYVEAELKSIRRALSA